MNFDFLVFPSPKCTYNKKKLGDELIFIPKYNKVQILEQKRPMTQANSPFYFSKQAISPFSKIVSMAKLTHSKKTKTTNFFSPKTSIDSIFQSPRKINVKIEMPNNNLQKMNLKEEEDAPTTPLLSYHDFIEEKTRLHQESKKLFKKPPRLQELSLNEERNSFFIKSGSDFEEGIDNGLTSPKKILNYNFKAPQANNLIKLNSLKDFTSRYNSRAQVFDITSLKNHNKTVKTIEVEKVDRFIPCLFLDPGNPSDKIMIFFHGNAEDIFQAYELLSCIESYLKVKIIAVEYPGYGVYTTHKSSSQLMQEDAVAVFDYLVNKVGYKEKNIVCLGRSIGSGPASYLASVRNPGALIMMSSFCSLKSVVKDHVGSLHNILKERFNNLETIKKVICPCFFIHGLQDKLISFQHSQKLHDACKGPSELCLPKEMSHSEFCFDSDFIIPLERFLRNYGFNFYEDEDESLLEKLKFPEEVYKNTA